MDHSHPSPSPLPSITTSSFGSPGAFSHRVFLFDNTSGCHLSPLDDIPPILPHGALSFVCTTPTGTWVRHVAATDEPYHPLRASHTPRIASPFDARQRMNKMQPISLRHVAALPFLRPPKLSSRKVGPREAMDASVSVTGEGGQFNGERVSCYPDNAPWNVGFLPRTSSPHLSPSLSLFNSHSRSLTASPNRRESEGDEGGGEPLEILDIGASRVRRVGDVYRIVPLGAFFLVEERGRERWGEREKKGRKGAWTVVGIAADDAMADVLREWKDVEVHLPGMGLMVKKWLQTGGALDEGPEFKTRQVLKTLTSIGSVAAQTRAHHEAWMVSRFHRAAAEPCMRPPAMQTLSFRNHLRSNWKAKAPKEEALLMEGAVPLSRAESAVLWDLEWFRHGPKVRGSDGSDDGEGTSSHSSMSEISSSPSLDLRIGRLGWVWQQLSSGNLSGRRRSPQVKFDFAMKENCATPGPNGQHESNEYWMSKSAPFPKREFGRGCVDDSGEMAAYEAAMMARTIPKLRKVKSLEVPLNGLDWEF